MRGRAIDRERFDALWTAGVPGKDIARELHCSVHGIFNHAHRRRLPKRKESRRATRPEPPPRRPDWTHVALEELYPGRAYRSLTREERLRIEVRAELLTKTRGRQSTGAAPNHEVA